jgi:hypothetical protein
VDQRLALATLIHDAFSTDDMVRTLFKLKKNGNVKCVAVAESSNHGPVNSKRQGDFVLGCITVSALACDHDKQLQDCFCCLGSEAFLAQQPPCLTVLSLGACSFFLETLPPCKALAIRAPNAPLKRLVAT